MCHYSFPPMLCYSLSCKFSFSAIWVQQQIFLFHIIFSCSSTMETNQQIQWDYVSTNKPVSSLYPDSCSAVSSVCVLYCQPAEEEENIQYLDTVSTDLAQPRNGHTYTERRQKKSMNDMHIYREKTSVLNLAH